MEHPNKTAWRSSETTIRGSRKARINVDRGMVTTSQMETTYDSVNVPWSAAMPTLTSHGIMRATVTGKP